MRSTKTELVILCSCGINQFCTQHVAAVLSSFRKIWIPHVYYCFLFNAWAEITRINFPSGGKRGTERGKNGNFLKQTASDCHTASGGWWEKQPRVLFCFHSREFHVVTESQHRVHKEKTKERNLHLKNFSEDPYIYIYFFCKSPERRRKESNKMYRNKLAGHAN